MTMAIHELVGASGFQVIPVIFPQTSASNTAIVSDRISVKEAEYVDFLVNIGTVTSGASGSITVNAYTAASSGSTLAVTFDWRKMTTVDTWSSATRGGSSISIDAAGDIVPADPVNNLIDIRVKAEDVRALSQTTDYNFVAVTVGALGGSKYVTVAAEAVCYPLRFQTDPPRTQVA